MTKVIKNTLIHRKNINKLMHSSDFLACKPITETSKNKIKVFLSRNI